MPELDTYEDREIDDENEYDAMSIGERRAAERAMDKRDGGRGLGFDQLLYC